MDGRELFGGAIRMVVPNNYCDVSDFRQVPDNQEVFVDANSERSIIIELMEAIDSSDLECARTHFMELVELNSSTQYQITHQESLKQESVPLLEKAVPILITGSFKAPKFNEESLHNVEIYMCVIRLANVKTDVIISINNNSNENENQLKQKEILDALLLMVSTFNVIDWNLFGS